MALETLSSNELLNFIIHDTISTTSPFNNASNYYYNDDDDNNNIMPQNPNCQQQLLSIANSAATAAAASPPPLAPKWSPSTTTPTTVTTTTTTSQGVQGRKKRKRRPKLSKNKQEAETQRMTHIAVERNRRKQMNEHLAVLRSLMPESYVQRGDQASIVGGAIEFVKELEHVLQSLEAKKFLLLQQDERREGTGDEYENKFTTANPFAQFFSYPQYTTSATSCPNNHQLPNKYTSQNKGAIADIEVTLIETHANIRVLSHTRLRQLSKLVAAFHTLYLSILHLNVTTLDTLVLYSISAKVEEGCQLNSADDIAGAVHHMLRIIEEATLSI